MYWNVTEKTNSVLFPPAMFHKLEAEGLEEAQQKKSADSLAHSIQIQHKTREDFVTMDDSNLGERGTRSFCDPVQDHWQKKET